MDIIPDRRPLSPLLLVVCLHILFVLGAWQSVSRVSEVLLATASHSGGNLTLPRDFALSMLELFIAPFLALLYIVFINHTQWFNSPVVYRHRLETVLAVSFLLTSLLAVSFGDKAFFGFAIAGSFGLLVGLYLKPVWAILLLLSFGVCLTLLIWWMHGSFMAVTLGLWFQNILLVSFVVGLGLRKLLKQ